MPCSLRSQVGQVDPRMSNYIEKWCRCLSKPHRIHGAGIYGNMDPTKNTPFMLAYIPAPWIRHGNTELLIETIWRTPPFPRLDRSGDLLVSALCPASTEANFASKAWDCAKASAHDGDTDIIDTSYDIKDAVYPLVNIQKAIENGYRNSGFSH